jgi:soluble lytic murein transglycosylase-like protein
MRRRRNPIAWRRNDGRVMAGPWLLAGLGAAVLLWLFSRTDKGADMVGKVIAAASGRYPGEEPYAGLIDAAEAQHGIPARLLAALLYQESHYRPDIIEGRVRSPTGAMGIAQFMPATAVEWLGSQQAALDPTQAIDGAARYLRWLFGRHSSWRLAVAAYNWGTGNVARKDESAWPAETRTYVANVHDALYPSA